MINPKLPESARTLSDVEEAARTLGRKLLVLNASVPRGEAFARPDILPGERKRNVGPTIQAQSEGENTRRHEFVKLLGGTAAA
jgi:hypothetical protein